MSSEELPTGVPQPNALSYDIRNVASRLPCSYYRGKTYSVRKLQLAGRLRRVGGMRMTMAKLLWAAIITVLVLGSVGCGGPSGCATATPGAGSGTTGGSAGGSSQPTGTCSASGVTP